MKRVAIYLRVSTTQQTTANQERELREIAERAGWQIVKVYKDHGISGSKGRDGRPAFDALCQAVLVLSLKPNSPAPGWPPACHIFSRAEC